MGLFQRLLGESRGDFSEAHPRDPVVAKWFGGGINTAAGVPVTADSAIRLTAVYACVRILTSTIASLPLNLYQRVDDGRKSDFGNALHNLVHTRPNEWQTSFEFREMLQGHVLLRGNAYAYIQRNNSGQAIGLIPLHPDRVTPFWAKPGVPAYAYQPENGERAIFLAEEIHHYRGYSSDGLVGLNPIEYMREAVGLSMAAEEFGARYFSNGTVASGSLKTDRTLSDKAYERLREDFMARSTGLANANKPLILEDGLTWQSLAVPPDQAQFLETRKFQTSEIARIFGVPPHMIGDTEKSTSWGTGIEQQSIGFVVYSLRPWLVRWEQALKRDLLVGSRYQNHYYEFIVEGLLRGDSAGRAAFYREMWGIGAFSINEIRAFENQNPIDDGDNHYVQSSYVPIGMLGMEEEAPSDPPEMEDSRMLALESAYTRALHQAFDRLNVCEVRALEKALNKERYADELVAFYSQHHGFVERTVKPFVANPEAWAREHIADSLRDLMYEDQPLPRDDLRGVLNTWRQTRADDLVAKHNQKLLEQMQ